MTFNLSVGAFATAVVEGAPAVVDGRYDIEVTDGTGSAPATFSVDMRVGAATTRGTRAFAAVPAGLRRW